MSDTEIEVKHGDEGVHRLIEDARASHVAFFSWVVAAGTYGFAAAEWGMSDQYPEYAWIFLVLGLAVGVGMSASIIATMGGDDDE